MCLRTAEGRSWYRPGTLENPECGEAALRIFQSSRPESAMNLLDDCELVNSTPRPRRDDSSIMKLCSIM